jgi:hypothetical protein
VTDLKHEYQIARCVEAMIDADDIDTPERYIVDDDYWDAATEMLAEEETGVMMDFDIVVVLYERDAIFPTDQGQWGYRAFRKPPEFTGTGCIHPMRATGLGVAKVEAISLHKRNCVGKG